MFAPASRPGYFTPFRKTENSATRPGKKIPGSTPGNANVWTLMSVDDELGYVYLPMSTPTNDWYGGQRFGRQSLAEALVCVKAETGDRIWHFQTVPHGLWDYDLPGAPRFCATSRSTASRLRAVAQITKTGFTFVFDRATGKPVWPIEERPVAQSTVPGERTSPTQPFPTKPAPYERQGSTEENSGRLYARDPG